MGNNSSLSPTKEPLLNEINTVDKPKQQIMEKNNEPCCNCVCDANDCRDLALACFICTHCNK